METMMIIGLGLIGLAFIIFIVSLIYHSAKVNKVTEEVISEYTE